MKIIFGLGNPGNAYKNNRHNVGYHAVEKLAETALIKFKRSFRLPAYLVELNSFGVILVKPRVFMNHSGSCVKAALKVYRAAFSDCLVIYDDADLSLGAIRFREKGSSGGHRGMSSIIEALGTDEVPRLKLGIGRNRQEDLAEYVLSDFTQEEEPLLDKSLSEAVKFCEEWLNR